MRIANITRKILNFGSKGKAITLPIELHELLGDEVVITKHNEKTRTLTIKY